jgi:hypothetical protein
MAGRGVANLAKLMARARPVAPRTRGALPLRGGQEGPDPNAPKWEQAVRSVLRKDEHVVFAVIAFWGVAIYGGKAALTK